MTEHGIESAKSWACFPASSFLRSVRRKIMKKRIEFCVFGAVLILSGCGATAEKDVGLNKEPVPVTETVQQAVKTTTENTYQDSTGSTIDNAETTIDSTFTRKDGERFEEVIILEGMEESVNYEHAINDVIGIEIDFEYESLVRKSESDEERFISIYDNLDSPDNYLEVTYRSENIDAATASISEDLSKEYEIQAGSFELENVSACTTIDTVSSVSGGRDLLRVYLVPSGEGTIVATAHFTFESAEGFGHRFDYMMSTLAVH